MAQSTQDTVTDGNTLSSHHAQSGGDFKVGGALVASAVVAGLFVKQSGGYYLWSTPDWNSFVSKFNELSTLSLISFDSWEQDASTTYFTGCWVQNPGGATLWRTPDWADFMKQHAAQSPTKRLLDIDIHASGGTQWFTGVWGGTPVKQIITSNKTLNEFISDNNNLLNQGMRLTKVQVIPTSESFHFTGLYEQGSGGSYNYVLSDWNAFYQKYQELSPNYQLTDFQVYDDNGSRFYVGVWRQTAVDHKFIFKLDWSSFINQWTTLSQQGYRLQKCIRYSNTVSVPAPQWDQFFRSKLGTQAEGYAYYVLHQGTVVANGINSSRGAKDVPQKAWMIDTRINLASVSKSVTAVAVIKLCAERNISLDDPFLKHMANQFPNAGPGVDKVSIRNLLTMQSSMVADGTLNVPDNWAFLKSYLAAQNVPAGAPGTQTPVYSNTNFTLLQALIDCLTGFAGKTPGNYVNWVQQNVLKPMGINLAVFNPVPDPQPSATLCYSGPADPRNGWYWSQFSCVGAGGWIASARELIKFLAGVRNHVVLSPTLTQQMFDAQMGWYTYNGVFGQYFHHNGGLLNGLSPAQGLVTGIIHLADGFDALLLVNTWWFDVIQLMVQAFETRG